MQNIISLVDGLIESAYRSGASDIHIDPEAQFLRVNVRIDGQLHAQSPLAKSLQPEIVCRIKILAGLRTDEHQMAQDGRFCLQLATGAVDIRVSLVPTYHGENIVMRLLKDHQDQVTLSSLGFSETNAAKIVKALGRRHGLILVTGPTGSGKTTTLYTLINMLKASGGRIITIEDPIEYSIEGVSQIGVNTKTGLTFANGLRSLLRQDPNIIMVGEIRDRQTARLAIHAALTGHLVLSTLHTSGAIATIPRLMDLGIENYLIASTLTLAISQRLVGRASGKGRINVSEVLAIDQALQTAIYQKATTLQLYQESKKQGFSHMLEDGFFKVDAGLCTIEHVLTALHDESL